MRWMIGALVLAGTLGARPAAAGPSCKDFGFDGFTADVWKGDDFGFIIERNGGAYFEIRMLVASTDIKTRIQRPEVTLTFDDGSTWSGTHIGVVAARPVDGEEMVGLRIRLDFDDELKARLKEARLVSAEAQGKNSSRTMTYSGPVTSGEDCCGVAASAAKTLQKMAACLD